MIGAVSRLELVGVGLAVGVALCLAACADQLRRGTTLYADGRFIEAAEVFEQSERLASTAPPRERAEYATYRGLTLLGLGDLRNAERWLAFAYQIERASPGALRPEGRAALDAGWEKLEERSRVRPAAPTSPTTALAASQPPVLPVPAPEPSPAKPHP